MDVWIQQNVGNVNIFLSLVKQRLSDNFIQNWNSRHTDSSRALFYRNFSFGYKAYLDTETTNTFRFALSRVCLSSHRLEIETGRWASPNSTPVENRLCTSCQKLEDGCHFVLECVRYNEMKRTLIPNYCFRRPNMFKLIELFTTDIKKMQRNLSVFLFKVREQYIFR